jgi:hypothetical protein
VMEYASTSNVSDVSDVSDVLHLERILQPVLEPSRRYYPDMPETVHLKVHPRTLIATVIFSGRFS